MAVDESGTIYVADWNSCRVDRIRPHRPPDTDFWTPREGVPSNALACTRNQRFLVASGADGSVAELDLVTGPMRITEETRLESLTAHVIEVAPNGTAYLPAFRSGVITEVSTTGALSTITIEELGHGEHVFTDCALTADGALLVVSHSTGAILSLDVA